MHCCLAALHLISESKLLIDHQESVRSIRVSADRVRKYPGNDGLGPLGISSLVRSTVTGISKSSSRRCSNPDLLWGVVLIYEPPLLFAWLSMLFSSCCLPASSRNMFILVVSVCRNAWFCTAVGFHSLREGCELSWNACMVNCKK